jgi:hypothetical protein
MSDTMTVTSTSARFSATWAVEILIEPGSVPDRPQPYSRTGAVYRPTSVKLDFTASMGSNDPAALKLENGSVFLRMVRDSIRLYDARVYGARLKANGEPGQHVVTERFYGQEERPEWLRGLITRTREQLS